MESFKVLKYPIATEKAIRLIEGEDKIIFCVERTADKKQIKEAIESLFKVKVVNVKTLVDTKGRKKAYIQLEKGKALDVATNMGIM